MKKPVGKLNVLMSSLSVGRFCSYIPPILKHVCGVDVRFAMHEVPVEHSHRKESIKKSYIEDAARKARAADLIIIPGGEDIASDLYGQEPHPFTDPINELSVRDEVESAMIKIAIEQDTPILMICRGYQLGMVTLAKDSADMFLQHLPDKTRGIHKTEWFDGSEQGFNNDYVAGGFVEDLLARKKSPLSENKNVTHDVEIKPDTITHHLYKAILGLPKDFDENIIVSETSKHHQGIVIDNDHILPNGLKCSAVSLAGDDVPILEGFESDKQSMCVGMQWHPEANATGNVAKMFKDVTTYAEFRKENKTVSFAEWSSAEVRVK